MRRGVGSGCIGGDGRERAGIVDVSANGDAAQGVIGDVALVVGVDEVLRGATPVGEGGEHGGPVGGGVDGEEGRGEVGGVVDGPAETKGAAFRGKDAGDDGRVGVSVSGEGDVEDDVGAAAHLDDLGLVADGEPCAAGGLELGAGRGAASVLDDEVLHVRAEVGESPGNVVVVPGDDEGRAGEGDSGDVEGGLRGGVRGLQVCLVPEFGHGEREVHVVREQRLSRGGARAGDGPCVGAGDAGRAGRLEEREGLIESEKVCWGRCNG